MQTGINCLQVPKYESSNTLQNSVNSWTIGKEERFNSLYRKSITDGYYNPDFLRSGRATGMGIGKRAEFIITSMQSFPSPQAYKVPSFIDENLKHKSGISISTRLSYKVTN